MYREWVKPQGILDALYTNLERSATSEAALAIRRLEPDGLFDENAKARLKLLVPHFQRAVYLQPLRKQLARSRRTDVRFLPETQAAAQSDGRPAVGGRAADAGDCASVDGSTQGAVARRTLARAGAHHGAGDRPLDRDSTRVFPSAMSSPWANAVPGAISTAKQAIPTIALNIGSSPPCR